MENQSEFLSSPKTLFIALFSILFVLKIWKILSKPKLKLPPGPPKLPIIGNIHQFIKNASPDLLRDMAKKYGSIMHFQLGEIHCIVVTCPKVTKEICKTHDIAFSQRPLHTAATILTQGTNDLVFAPYSELWRQLRKFSIIELLSVKRVQQFQSLREEETSCLMKTIAGGNYI